MQVKKQQSEPDIKKWTGSKLGKKYVKAVYCHPAFLTYSECILRSVGLEEAHAGIRIAGRNTNNLRYADDITIMAGSEEELQSLLMKMKNRVKNVA